MQDSSTGSAKKILVGVSRLGLLENPRFEYDYQHDGIFELAESIQLFGEPYSRVRGTFWEIDLALRFHARGSGPRTENNWSRDLATALREAPELYDRVFGIKIRTFPDRWLTMVGASQIQPGLNAIERHYKAYLPHGYQGLGVHLAGEEAAVPRIAPH